MAKFIGLWSGDENSHKNFEPWAKVAGIPDDMVQKIKKSKSTCEYKRDGDNWSVHINSDFAPDATYKFKSGVQLETKDPMGGPCKLTSTIISDDEMTESNFYEMMKWKEEKVHRKVDGDTMNVTYEMEGVKMSYVMRRC